MPCLVILLDAPMQLLVVVGRIALKELRSCNVHTQPEGCKCKIDFLTALRLLFLRHVEHHLHVGSDTFALLTVLNQSVPR